MQQSIRYKGLSLTPDEMAVENGALSLCGNLELHDGALRPSIVTGTPLSQPLTINGVVAKILYVHETGNYRHLIAIASSAIYWFLQDGSLGSTTPIKSFDYEASVLSVNSIGNTLIIVATDGIHYALWVDGGYKNLPQKPPFVEISFYISDDYPENYSNGGVDAEGSVNGFYSSLQKTPYTQEEVFNKVKFTMNDAAGGKELEVLTIKEDKQSDITQSIYALVNRTNNFIARKGRFYANFFVRYCYKMFDGSMIMHSSPVFIPVQVPDSYIVISANTSNWVNAGKGEILFFNDYNLIRYDGKNNATSVHIDSATFIYHPRNVDLNYKILDAKRAELEEWKDVIKSVDVFITPPISNVDTSEKIVSFRSDRKNYGLGKGIIEHYYELEGENSKYKVGTVTAYFPSLSEDAYRNKLKNTSTFYKVCSLKISDLTNYTTKKLPVDKNAVYQVSLQEQMKDDYKTHNSLFAQGGYVYNHRLNLYGMKEKLFQGFSGYVMLPGLYILKYDDSTDNLKYRYKIQKIVVSLNTTSGTKYVESSDKFFSRQDIDGFMIGNLVKFYPDSRADKMAIFCKDSSDNDVIFVFPLEQ